MLDDDPPSPDVSFNVYESRNPPTVGDDLRHYETEKFTVQYSLVYAKIKKYTIKVHYVRTESLL